MKTPPITVTDHAVLRYLERVLQIDIEAHRAEIARNVALAEEFEGASAVLKNGFRYRLRGGAVVTVVPVHAPDPRTSRCDRRGQSDE